MQLGSRLTFWLKLRHRFHMLNLFIQCKILDASFNFYQKKKKTVLTRHIYLFISQLSLNNKKVIGLVTPNKGGEQHCMVSKLAIFKHYRSHASSSASVCIAYDTRKINLSQQFSILSSQNEGLCQTHRANGCFYRKKADASLFWDIKCLDEQVWYKQDI